MSRDSAVNDQGRIVYVVVNKKGREVSSYFTTSDVERFWSKVARTDGCWLWRGAINPSTGYGTFSMARGLPRGKQAPLYAHRVAWELAHGPIPVGQWMLHHCDVPACVNPSHLFLGTHKTNMEDAQHKGRLHISRPKRQTISDAAIAEMKRLAEEGWLQVAIAHKFSVSKPFVCLLLKGKRRQHPQPRPRKAVA